MNLEKFLSLGEEHVISTEDAEILNECLAKISLEDIPICHRARIVDYLTIAFNMNSIERENSPALGILLSKLQIHI